MLQMAQQHLVLLPGLDGTGQLFGPLLNVLPAQFKPTIVRFPPDKRLTYQQLFACIREVMPWNVPYTLVAESFSGPLAVMFAAEQPRDLRAIVLCASFVCHPLAPLLGWAGGWVNESLFRKPPPPLLLKKLLAGDDCPEMLLNTLTQAIASVRSEVLAHRLRMALETDAREALRRCEKPILYLLAERDRLVGRRGLEGVLSVRPNVNVTMIDAPHLLLQRRPKEAIAAIQQFIGARSRPEANLRPA
jgi:pimeloyl-ACP methyl ester carboxylesterase